MPTKIFLIIIILTILSLKHAHAEYKRDHHNHLNPENHINPKPGEQPLVANGNFLDSTQFIQSKNQNHGRRLNLDNLPVDIVIFQQPGNSTGGLPSAQQTIIRAVNQNGDWARAQDSGSFLGERRTTEQLLHHVICAIGINPSIVASARQRNMTTDEDLWSNIQFDTPKALFYKVNNEVNGIMEATFEGVFINELGNGYTFQYISRMSPSMNNFPTYFTESKDFNIILGPVHRLSLYTPEGTATGGLPFRPQPTLAIVDRGNNICVWDQTTTVRVELLYSPEEHPDHESVGSLQSDYGAADFNHTVYRGRATFLGLNFDVAGYPYKLRYTANGPTGVVTVDSINLTVGVGPADKLVVVKQAAGTRGGIDFIHQPYLLVKDAGDNILVDDSTSYCTVSISNNPSGGLLKSLPLYYFRNEALDLYTLVSFSLELFFLYRIDFINFVSSLLFY
jgi:hypothetical protein